MTEQIQCPVCTLFLHAGMSLFDHLETHPKEQVIKALVQITLCNGTTPADCLIKKVEESDCQEQSNDIPAKTITTTTSLIATTQVSINAEENSSESNEVSAAELKGCDSNPEQSCDLSFKTSAGTVAKAIKDGDKRSSILSALVSTVKPNNCKTPALSANATQNRHLLNGSDKYDGCSYSAPQNGSIAETNENRSENDQSTKEFYIFGKGTSSATNNNDSNSHRQPVTQCGIAQFTQVSPPSSLSGFQSNSPSLPVQLTKQSTQNHPQQQSQLQTQQNLKLIYGSSLGPPPPLQVNLVYISMQFCV